MGGNNLVWSFVLLRRLCQTILVKQYNARFIWSKAICHKSKYWKRPVNMNFSNNFEGAENFFDALPNPCVILQICFYSILWASLVELIWLNRNRVENDLLFNLTMLDLGILSVYLSLNLVFKCVQWRKWALGYLAYTSVYALIYTCMCISFAPRLSDRVEIFPWRIKRYTVVVCCIFAHAIGFLQLENGFLNKQVKRKS